MSLTDTFITGARVIIAQLKFIYLFIYVGERFSTHVHTGSGAHPASYTMDTGSLNLG
jgi:hypothetical protein